MRTNTGMMTKSTFGQEVLFQAKVLSIQRLIVHQLQLFGFRHLSYWRTLPSSL